MVLFLLLFLFLLGLIIGSFLNAWIWRTRHGKSIAHGRSMCPDCKRTLGFFDLVPVVSYIFLKGKCRYCHKHISVQYPLVEIVTGLLFACIGYMYWDVGLISNVIFTRDLIIVALLVAIFVYDFLYMEILDRMTTIPAIVLFILSLFFGWNEWGRMLVGIGIGAGFFLLQYVLSKGKWIGGGDIRLGLFMGVILGYPRIILALFIAYIIGAAVSLVLIAMKKKQLVSETPFGTYLTIATFIAMLWGDKIVTWYVGMLGL